MSMDIGGAKGGPKSDINVTPLVDVMLVLLIIVMLIAPMLQKGVDVALPEATNAEDKPDTADQTVVHVDANSNLYVNALPVNEGDVITRLQTILESVADKVVYLKGDKDAPYGAIMKMMDALRGAGIETVGLITEKQGGNREEGGQ
ncbi:MAG: biopolymer transporter ExbD [Acidobacteria bacterium]|jgi:biopolymer transport protein TolR|nr:biopolymer transporter ExbD [Acidobacteriota bacterium]